MKFKEAEKIKDRDFEYNNGIEWSFYVENLKSMQQIKFKQSESNKDQLQESELKTEVN